MRKISLIQIKEAKKVYCGKEEGTVGGQGEVKA